MGGERGTGVGSIGHGMTTRGRELARGMLRAWAPTHAHARSHDSLSAWCPHGAIVSGASHDRIRLDIRQPRPYCPGVSTTDRDDSTRNDLAPAAAAAWRVTAATWLLSDLVDDEMAPVAVAPREALPVAEAAPRHVDGAPGYRLGGPLDGLVWD